MACSYRRIASSVSPFEAGDLGRHQCVLVGESRWIVFGPLAQLFPVRRQEFAPPGLLVGRSVLIERRHRQRGVVKVVEQLRSGRLRSERSGFALSAAARASA